MRLYFKMLCWHYKTIIAVFIFGLKCSIALYEDQVGKFDWKKELIGEVLINLCLLV